MSKKIFKVEDKVYHVLFGWGIITSDFNQYVVKFINVKKEIAFDTTHSLISFTEYTLQGFSQERPIELPAVGELCLFRDYDNECWKGVEFKTYDKTLNYPFVDSNDDEWKQMKRIKILD